MNDPIRAFQKPLIDFRTEDFQMATTALTEGDFAKTVQDNDMVIVDFWAEWCGPCRKFAPAYEKVSGEHPDVVFGKVDTEAQPGLQMQFGIQSIPTLMIFREGVILYNEAGAIPEAALQDLITKAKELDMEEVKKQLADS